MIAGLLAVLAQPSPKQRPRLGQEDVCLGQEEAREIVGDAEQTKYTCLTEIGVGVGRRFAQVLLFLGESYFDAAGCTHLLAAQCNTFGAMYRSQCCLGTDVSFERLEATIHAMCPGRRLRPDIPAPEQCTCWENTIEYEDWSLGSCPTGYLDAVERMVVRTALSPIVTFESEPASDACHWGRDIGVLASGDRVTVACTGAGKPMHCDGAWDELRNFQVVDSRLCD